MTDHIISTSINVTTGNAFGMRAGDTVLVSQGVSVSTASADYGIFVTDTGARTLMTIAGSVSGGFYGIFSSISGSAIVVGETGLVTGGVSAITVTGTHIVRNSGTISGSGGGISHSGSGTLFIFNDGLIKTPTRAAITGGSDNDVVVNEGTIEGTIFLNQGDDTYYGRDGFAGLVHLGAGNDWAYDGLRKILRRHRQ
jgi:hypothetical protein